MAYFKAVGKFIDNCGLMNVMVNSQMLANGSVKSYIAGKHFNRCKRLHPIVSLALQILHFEHYLDLNNIECSEETKMYLIGYLKTRSDKPYIQERELLDIFNNYQVFKQQTLNGEHGKTPQFYMMYVSFIDYYLTPSASIRRGNFQLFTSILPKIANLFFAFNQQNYAGIIRCEEN